jgi:hypothetical protein
MYKTDLDLDGLRAFLLYANKPYATKTDNAQTMPDGSHEIVVTKGDWHMNDNFFGGDPYGGRQVIYYKKRPVWIMTYYGRAETEQIPLGEIIGFLRESLQHGTFEEPYRGPRQHKNGDFEYSNLVDGSLLNYQGKEAITHKGQPAFWTVYSGGLVDAANAV